MSELVPFIYILVLTLLGWALSLLSWKRERKWITAIVAVIMVPMMFIGPAITQRHGDYGSLPVAVGITALVWGAVALGIGWGGSVLLRAWRGRRG
jgi:predicted permease